MQYRQHAREGRVAAAAVVAAFTLSRGLAGCHTRLRYAIIVAPFFNVILRSQTEAVRANL